MNKRRPQQLVDTVSVLIMTDPKATDNKQDKNYTLTTDYSALATAGSTVAILNAVIGKIFGAEKLTLRSVGKLSLGVMTLILLKRLLENTGAFFDTFSFMNVDWIKYLIQRSVYKHVSYDIVIKDGSWYYKQQQMDLDALQAGMNKLNVNIGCPGTRFWKYYSMLIRVTTTPYYIRFTIPDVHTFHNQIVTAVINPHKKILCGTKTSVYKGWMKSEHTIILEPIAPCDAMEVDNYRNLTDALWSKFMGDKIVGAAGIPHCINFNGMHGTGKTTYAHFVASQNMFDKIVIFNMVTDTFGLDLKTLCAKIEASISPSASADGTKLCCLIIFDEIDKWFTAHVKNKVDLEWEESRKKTGSIKANQNNDNKNNNAMPIVPDKMTDEDAARLTEMIKHRVMDQLHCLIDGNLLSSKNDYVFIFNTNEFAKSFHGIDSKYDATFDRIQTYTFFPIGRKHVMEYLRIIVAKTIQFAEEKGKENNNPAILRFRDNLCSNISLIEDIDDKISITYRKLKEIIVVSCYDMTKIVKDLNQYAINKDLERSMDGDLVEMKKSEPPLFEIKSEEELI